METPICVADAKTIIDHIHDIRRWIYAGQLRLVVPSSTYEHVEQLYQKSTEQKPTTKGNSRPRSLGKPVKKEYPTFDINPRVTKDFLSRLKAWKDEDPTSEARQFFHEKENHDAVSFQQPNEQYTPWKDLEVEEEKPEIPEDRPATWADALRRKQNLANGTSGNSDVSKGPAKPKLVARTLGHDTSPWKVKRDAPKVSAKEVPGALRPFMSCVLWRLHQSIERNDTNQLFLMSGQAEVCDIARKLNIVVRSFADLKAIIASKTVKADLSTFGDLEREFGAELANRNSHAATISIQGGEEEMTLQAVNDDVNKQEDEIGDSSSTIGTVTTPGEQSTGKGSPYRLDASTQVSEKTVAQEILTAKVNGIGETEALENPVVGSTMASAANDSPKPSIQSHETSEGFWENTKDLEKIQNMLLAENSVNGRANTELPILVERKTRKALDPTIAAFTSVPLAQENTNTSQVETQQQLNHNTTPPARASSPVNSTSQAPPTEEPEDSDEEVVVFKPQAKRLSAQKKPVDQSPRPTTATSTSQPKSPEKTPRQLTQTNQSQPRTSNRDPKQSTVVSHAHPQPANGPTIIDPDAFGRSFAVNPNPSPRNSMQIPRQRHSPRPSVHNSQPAQNSRASPSRNDGRLSPAPPFLPEDKGAPSITAQSGGVLGSQPNQAARKSPQRRFRTPNPNAVANRRLHQPVDYVPRTTVPESQFQQGTPEPQVIDSNEFVPRTPLPERPRLGEPVSIEPRTTMPEVQYVLKSGSTRAATRGRGKLWIP